MKRPESTNLFQRFQSHWLSKNDEQSLENFLRSGADTGSHVDKQLFAYYLTQKGREIKALKYLNESLASSPNNSQILMQRAEVHSRLLDFDKAVVDIDRSLTDLKKSDAFKLNANKLKGRFLSRQGKIEAAVKHWQALADKHQDDEELVEDVIDVLLSDGLTDPALKLAVQLRDKTKDPYKKALRSLRIADVHKRKGNRELAVEVYKDTLDKSGSGS